jgi:sulfonate transport system substrate-binding protein
MSGKTKYEGKEIRYTICPVGNASYIAAKKGWLNEGLAPLGVTATLLQNLPQERWAAHYNYKDAALFREGGNIPPIWSKAQGEEPVLIGLTFLDHKQYLLVRADSPIDSVEQLRKHRLGLQSRPEFIIDYGKASAQQGFNTALAARGVAKTEVTFVELPVSEADIAQTAGKKSNYGRKREVEALEKGEVDAIYTSGTRAQALLDTGHFKVIFAISADADQLFPINNAYPNILTVSKRLAEEAPEIVVEYIKQMLRAAT